MIQVTEIIEKIKAENIESANKMEIQRYFLQIKPDDFKALFLELCRKEILSRNQDMYFIIDEDNKNVINQLFYYLTGSSQFQGNHGKGILLAGSIGTGKTIIMNAFCSIVELYTNKIVFRTSCKAHPGINQKS